VKKSRSHELKGATTTTKTKVTKVRAELTTIHMADVNASVTPIWRCCWSDKLSILFEL